MLSKKFGRYVFIIMLITLSISAQSANASLWHKVPFLIQNVLSRAQAKIQRNKITSTCVVLGTGYALTEVLMKKYTGRTLAYRGAQKTHDFLYLLLHKILGVPPSVQPTE